MSLVLFLQLCATAASFNVTVCELPTPHATVFLAHADTDGKADVFILQGHSLTIHTSMKPAAPVTFQFPEKTVLFDVADIDGNDRNELVGLGDHCAFAWSLPDPNETPPRQLFTFEQSLWEEGNLPYPTALVIEKDGKRSILVPCETALELRALDGTLLTTIPAGAKVPSQLELQKQQDGWTTSNVVHWAGTDTWTGVSSFSSAYAPEVPDDLKSQINNDSELFQSGWTSNEAGKWSMFQINRNSDTIKDALVHSVFSFRNETVIRIRDRKTGVIFNPRPDVAYRSESGTERRYPGMYLWSQTPPDFNRDGFADLVLVRMPNPGTSVDALTRTVMDGTCPFTVSVHLFLPDQNRFEANATAQLTFRVPILKTIFEGGLRSSLLEDLNGDGRTDCAFRISDSLYAAWLYTDSGFNKEPDYTYSYSGNIDYVQCVKGGDKDGSSSILLRTEKALHILTVPVQR